MISSRSSSARDHSIRGTTASAGPQRQRKYRDSSSTVEVQAGVQQEHDGTTTTRSGQARCRKSRTISAGTEKSSVRSVTIALIIFASIATPVEIR